MLPSGSRAVRVGSLLRAGCWLRPGLRSLFPGFLVLRALVYLHTQTSGHERMMFQKFDLKVAFFSPLSVWRKC